MFAVSSTLRSVLLGLAYTAIFDAKSISNIAATGALTDLPIPEAEGGNVTLALKYVCTHLQQLCLRMKLGRSTNSGW
jgi:hypothetical protein